MSAERIILDGPAIAHDLEIPASTVRRWASEGRLTGYGVDERGRRRYDLLEVERVAGATRRGRPRAEMGESAHG